MPLVASKYKAPFMLRNGNVQTIATSFFRIVRGVNYTRKRITTPDDDFLDIDWLLCDSRKIAVIIHGLEASSQMPYIKGMAKILFNAGYQVAAMNLRGCSGELNKQVRAYHSGTTDDVETVLDHILTNHDCDEIVIVGFSLGGNLLLKYLGEKGAAVPSQIKKAIAISVPCDLEAAAGNLDRQLNFFYRHHFLRTLKQKALLRIRNHRFPLSEQKLTSIKTLFQYDDCFTAPLFGFDNALDYYRKCSSKHFLKNIAIPTLILTAKDDPFFTNSCFPFDECRDHPNVFLETPLRGGHVGFILNVPWGKYYSEERVIEFIHHNESPEHKTGRKV